MRATNGKLCAPRVRTKPVSRGVHVWNSSHLVARYVLIHVGARNDAHHGALHRRSPTNVRGPVRVGRRAGSAQGQAWCQAAMRAWVGPQARARRGRLMLHSRSSRKSWTTTQRHDVHSHARNLRRHFATRRRWVSPPHRSDRRISALKFSAQGRPMQPRAELRSSVGLRARSSSTHLRLRRSSKGQHHLCRAVRRR